MNTPVARWLLTFLLLIGASACADESDPVGPVVPVADVAAAKAPAPVPSPVVAVTFGDRSLELWPYTGTDLTGTASDPINVLFPGAGTRDIRAALLTLDGDRTAFGMPAAPPFDCTWKEAVGSNQTSWAAPVDWTGSAIQLECGDFDPVRFHLRLFPAGGWTIANAHFEVLIPGTNDHEVLSWELAEGVVTVDLLRSGLLDPVAPISATQPINPSPSYRTIRTIVYNGLPPELRALVSGSPAPATEPVPILTDGTATVLNLAGEVSSDETVTVRESVLEFGQIIPKPFCASGPFDYIRVEGPIRFRQQVVVTPSGNFLSHFHARGRLELTPVNPLTGEPVGAPYVAKVAERYRNMVTDHVTMVSNFRLQILLQPSAGFGGRLQADLRIGPGTSDSSGLSVTCGS